MLRSGRHVGGPVVEEAETGIAQLFGARFAVGLNSGTDALVYGLKAMGIGEGSKVAVPAISFFATAEAVLLAGATPIFVDTLADRPQLDPGLIPNDVDAIIPVHLFGALSPEIDLDLPILADAAQAAGWGHGNPQGACAALSFYPTKTLGCAGDGGALLTDDEQLAQRVRRLGWHGQVAPNVHDLVEGSIGGNSRLDPIQAAVLLAHIGDLQRRVEARHLHAAHYEGALEGSYGLLPRDPRDAVHQFAILCGEPRLTHAETREIRRLTIEALSQRGVASAIYYPHPMDVQPIVTGRPIEDSTSSCPNAASFTARLLALPCHAELTPDDLDRVAEALLEARRQWS